MGMDVHQAMTVVVVLDAGGKVVLETMVRTEAAAIIRLVQSLSGPLRVNAFVHSGLVQDILRPPIARARHNPNVFFMLRVTPAQ
jgi:hypothetical protein